MGNVIVVANQKGGVGKTTTVINLGACLAALGYRVALIDLDSQGALSAAFGYNPYHINLTSTTMLMDQTIKLGEILRKVRTRLQLAPASAELLSAEYRLLKQPDRTKRLRKAINPTLDSLDYLIIDTPPNLGLLTVNAWVAAGYLLIPVKTEAPAA